MKPLVADDFREDTLGLNLSLSDPKRPILAVVDEDGRGEVCGPVVDASEHHEPE